MEIAEIYQYNHRLKGVPLWCKNLFWGISLSLCFIANYVAYYVLSISLLSFYAIYASRIKMSYWLKILLVPFIFIGTSTLALTVRINSGNELINTLYLDPNYFDKALLLWSKSMAIVSVCYLYILTTSISELGASMRAVKIPALFTELFLLTYKFIFSTLNLANQLYCSQRCRLAYSSNKSRIKSFSFLMSGLFITSFNDANTANQALELRGGYEQFKWHKPDVEIDRRQTAIHLSFMLLEVGLVFILKML